MKVGEILSGRSALQARARRELWSALYDIMPSYSWIGRLFHRDHTTIAVAIRKHKAERAMASSCVVRKAPGPFPCEGPSSCVGPEGGSVMSLRSGYAETSGEELTVRDQESVSLCAH